MVPVSAGPRDASVTANAAAFTLPMPQIQLFGAPHYLLSAPGVGLRPAEGQSLPMARREAALLAWLHLEGPTPRAALAGLIWPGGSEPRARTNLRQLLLRMRRQAGELLAETDGLLALAPGLQVAARAPGRLLGALEFDDAPELAEWLAQQRAHDQRERVRLSLAAGEAALARADLDGALAAANAALAADATAEQAYRLRMATLARQGDRAAAIAAWDDCRTALRQAFGIAPSAATNALGRQLLARDEASAAFAPASVHHLPARADRPLPLAGRAPALARLQQALSLGQLLLITGPGGIGKSRLLAELLPPAPGCLTVAAQLGDHDDLGALVRRLLVEALSRYAPGLDPSLRTMVERLVSRSTAWRSPTELRQHVEAARQALEACCGSGLRQLVVEDLHHADVASSEALLAWAGPWLRAGAGPRPQLVVTARREALSTAGDRLLDTLRQEAGVLHHELQPLDVDGIAHLLAALPAAQPGAQPGAPDPASRAALAQALLDAVGGNPAFVIEAVRHLHLANGGRWQPGDRLQAPPTLLESVGARLSRLPADALQLAQLAAVAESDFTPELAALATGRSLLALAAPLARLESAQVFADGRLSHDLIAQAVKDSLPRTLVAPLHRLVADRLVAAQGREARIAHHLDAAGDGARAAHWHALAGDRAMQVWQPREAAAAYARAARGRDGQADRAGALAAWLDAARAALLCEDGPATRAALDAASPLLHLPQDHAMWLARQARWQHLAHDRAGSTATAIALAARLDDCSSALGDAELANALRVVCTAVENGAPAEPLMARCESACARLLAGPPDAAAAWAHAYGMTLHWLALPRDALRVLEAAWQRLDDRHEPATRLGLLNQMMRVRHSLGDLEAAIADGRRLQALAQRTRIGLMTECDVLHVTGTMLVAHGKAAEGLACFDEVERRLGEAGQPMREVFTVSLAHACLSCGQHDRAGDLLRAIPRGLNEPLNVVYDQARWWALARLAHATGQSVAPWIDRLRALAGMPPALALVNRVALATVAPLAADELEALRHALAERGFRGLERTVSVLSASLALEQRRLDDALRHAQRALALIGCVDAWVDQAAMPWLPLHAVLAACGQAALAQQVLDRGAQWVRVTARQWHREQDRQAWLVHNPAHRALLERAGLPVA